MPLLNIEYNLGNTNLPQNVIIFISKFNTISEFVNANFKEELVNKDTELSRIFSIISKVFTKVISSDFELTAPAIFNKINQHLDRLEEQIKFYWQEEEGKEKNLNKINSVINELLENLPLLQVRLPDNEAIKLYDDLTSQTLTISENKKVAESDLNEIKNYKKEIQSISQILAGKVLNNFYEIRAETERKNAFLWTLATWSFAILTIAALVYVFLKQIDAATNNEINYALLSTKILTTGTLGLIAKWSSKRANRHLAEESKYHRLAVNMATINTFIAPLSDEEKYKVISAVAIKVFTEGTGNDTPTEFETISATDLVKSVLTKTDK